MTKRILLFLLMLAAVGHQLHAQCSSAFFDGFESGSYTPTWTFGTGMTSAAVTNTTAAQGTYSLEGVGGSSTHLTGFSTVIPASTPSSASWYINPAVGSAATAYMVFGDASVSATNCVVFAYYQGATGTIRFVSNITASISVPAATWHKIELQNINYTTRTFDIYVNNTLLQANFPFRSTTINNVTRIHLYNFNAATAYWDQVTFGNTPISLSTASTNVTCNAGNNGSADLTVSGGAAPYSYLWSNGATTQDLTGVTAGTYSVVVTDNVGCTDTAFFTLTEPLAITAVSSYAEPTCYDSATGLIFVLPGGGGVPPYTFNWSTGDTVAQITGLAAGTYSCTITDANGCTHVFTQTLGQPSQLVTTLSAGQILCNGSSATIAATTSGGVSGYTYMWSDNSTNDSITAVAGTYFVTTTDFNGCSRSDTISVSEPAAMAVAISATSPVCSGSGSLQGSATGGTPGYTYLWSTGDTTSGVSNAAPGTYTLIVTDANGCSDSSIAIINPPANVVVFASIAANTSCTNPNGLLFAVPSGGAGPYTFLWSNGDTTQQINNLTAGTYTCTVTDTNGCSGSNSFVVSGPIPPVASVNFPVSNVCDDDAPLTLFGGSPAGGFWSGPGVNGVLFTPGNAALGANSISYIYVDSASGCSDTASTIISVSECTGITESNVSAQFICFPNPAADQLTISASENTGAAVLYMYDAQGRLAHTQNLPSSSAGTRYTIQLDSFATGQYFVRIVNAGGIVLMAEKVVLMK